LDVEFVSDVSFSTDGSRLVVTDDFGTASVIDVSTGVALRSVSAGGTSSLVAIDVNPADAGRAVVATGSGDPVVWNVSAGHAEAESALEALPDGRVVTTSYDGSATLWSSDGSPTPLLPPSDDPIADASVTRSGDLLATVRDSGAVQVWSVRSGDQVLARSMDPNAGGLSVALSPDGGLVAGGDWYGEVIVWDVGTGAEAHRFDEAHTDAVASLDFGKDSGQLVSASNDRTAVIWDLDTGDNERLRPDGRSQGAAPAVEARDEPMPTAAAWSADGSTLALAWNDGRLQVFAAESGQQVGADISAHSGTIHDIAFDDTGQRMVSVGADRAVIVWEVDSRTILDHYQHRSPAYEVTFTDDGQRLQVTDGTGYPHVVLLNTDELLDSASDKATRELSAQECERFLGDVGGCAEG
jgi:WD40 repeat protein